jgi:hypothetical protein
MSVSDLCELPRAHTRAAYDQTPSALPRALQDEIVLRHRRGESRATIVSEMGPPVTEWAVKKIFQALRDDPQAFMRKATAGIVVWSR